MTLSKGEMLFTVDEMKSERKESVFSIYDSITIVVTGRSSIVYE